MEYRFTSDVEGDLRKEEDVFWKGGFRKDTHQSCIASLP